MKAVREPVRLERIMPASVKRIRLPDLPAKRASRAMPMAAPASAKRGSSSADAASPKKRDEKAPSAALDHTPKSPGSASRSEESRVGKAWDSTGSTGGGTKQ